MNLLNEVKNLYDMGFATIWLYPKSKRPIGEDWTSGPRKPWKVLLKSFREANNVGVRLGGASQFKDKTFLAALDCDVKSSDPIHLKEMQVALNNFAPAHEWAPRVISGRGGGSCHIYFRTNSPQVSFKAISSSHKVRVHMPSVAPSKSDKNTLTDQEIKEGFRMRLAWEIDVYGEGKQVVLPPSTHPDTFKEYMWEAILKDFDSIPLVKNFEPSRVRLLKKSEKGISFEDVNLDKTEVTPRFKNLIKSGDGFDNYASRSEALFASLNGLILAGLTDGQIHTVLTDDKNFMSEKPLESGRGDIIQSARWLQTQIDKIRSEKSTLEAFDDMSVVDDLDELLSLDSDEAEAQLKELIKEEEVKHWTTKLKGKEGAYKNTAENLYLIIKNKSEGLLYAYNEFTHETIMLKNPPWCSLKVNRKGRAVVDSDTADFILYLSKTFGIESNEGSVDRIIGIIGRENSFHPLKDYFKKLQWDGTARIGSWLRDYLDAKGPTAYVDAVGTKMLVAAVARVMHPGCKFDYVPIFEGKQGIGKSSAIRILASDRWFSDSLGDITNKDAVANLQRAWIVEIGEMAAMDRNQSNELKSFVSRQTDMVRVPFGRKPEDFPRHSIFVGTTNDVEYFKDETGNRRYWPVKVGECKFKELARDRDQLWAEALVAYDLGETLYLDKGLELVAAQEQSSRYIADAFEEQIISFLDEAINLPEPIFGQSYCTTTEMFQKSKRLSDGNVPDPMTTKRIARAMRRLDFKKGRAGTGSFLRVWRPPPRYAKAFKFWGVLKETEDL